MNQFVAPQFIDVEDRIFGPITTRQFVIMIIAGVIIFVSYKIFDRVAFAVISLLTAIAAVLFGFVKINGRRFHEFLKNMSIFFRRPKIRVWHKNIVSGATSKDKFTSDKDDLAPRLPARNKINPQHLANLALIVDTGGRYQGR